MNTVTRFAVALAVGGAAWISGARRQADAGLRERPAVDLILDAFEDHPLVGLSEGAGHGQLETRDFFSTLIRDSRFPAP